MAGAGRISGAFGLTLPPCMQVSVDPVTGEAVPYPPRIKNEIETAYATYQTNGGVPAIDFGRSFHGATIHFAEDDEV